MNENKPIKIYENKGIIMSKISIIYNGKEIEYSQPEWEWKIFEDGSVRVYRMTQKDEKRIVTTIYYSNVPYRIITIREEEAEIIGARKNESQS